MKGITNYFELYSVHGLPIQEAYYIAGFNYFLTKDPAVFEMIEALQSEICRLKNRAPYSDEDAADYCVKIMEKTGYYEEESPNVFFPKYSFYGNEKNPPEQRIRNNVDYYGLYQTGAVSLHEALVLAKNKAYLINDDRMLTMIFAIEDKIMEECRRNPSLGDSVASYMQGKGYRFKEESKDFYVPVIPGEEKEPEKKPVGKTVKTSSGCIITSCDAYDVYSVLNPVRDEAIIYCHGGAFRDGDKGDNPEFLTALAEKTSMRVYSVGFRNLDEARKIRTMVDDISGVISLISAKDAVKRFHLVGASSGAYLAWILSLMLSNPRKFDVGYDYSVSSAVLLSGYFLFDKEHPLIQSLYLFPTFQDFPEELKSVDMDYSGYWIPPVLLITGDKDGCLNESKALYNAVKSSNGTDIEMFILNSEDDKADHCFMIERPDSAIAKDTIARICAFIGRRYSKAGTVAPKHDQGANPVKGLKFFGPPKPEEMSDLEEHIKDEGLLRFYRYSAGCVVVNQNGEIRIFTPSELFMMITLNNRLAGLLQIGTIKDKGLLFASTDGKIIMFDKKSFDPLNPDSAKKIGQWDSIQSLLQLDLK